MKYFLLFKRRIVTSSHATSSPQGVLRHRQLPQFLESRGSQRDFAAHGYPARAATRGPAGGTAHRPLAAALAADAARPGLLRGVQGTARTLPRTGSVPAAHP